MGVRGGSYHSNCLLESLNTRMHKTRSKNHFGDLGVDGREVMRLILHKEEGAINGLKAGHQGIGCSRRRDFPLLHTVQSDCGLSSTASSEYLWDVKLTTWHHLVLSLGTYSSKLLLPNLFSWHSASALSFIHTHIHTYIHTGCEDVNIIQQTATALPQQM